MHHFVTGQTPNGLHAVITNETQMARREDKEEERMMKAELMGGMMAAVISAGRGQCLKISDVI